MERFKAAWRALVRPRRRPRRMRAGLCCERLEGRALLSYGGYGGPMMMPGGPMMVGPGNGGGLGHGAAWIGHGPMGLNKMHRGGPSGKTVPAAVQGALQTLRQDFDSGPHNVPPSPTALSALQADVQAIRDGSLSGDAAQAQLKADQAAILQSQGNTPAQITQILADEQALQAAIQASGGTLFRAGDPILIGLPPFGPGHLKPGSKPGGSAPKHHSGY